MRFLFIEKIKRTSKMKVIKIKPTPETFSIENCDDGYVLFPQGTDDTKFLIIL